MKNDSAVAAFERAFSEYCGAKFAIALNSGTSTLHTALVALGVKPGDRVAVPPLTMSATTIAVLHAGAVPVFCDVDPKTWLMDMPPATDSRPFGDAVASLPVSLYGLHHPYNGQRVIDDAAQTLRKHSGCAFTSYSFQASKILALGEGGMLATDDPELATRAREFSSLGYRMRADQPRISSDVLKSPTFERHHSLGYNYRMSDLVASIGVKLLDPYRYAYVGEALEERRQCAALYRDAIAGCDWLTPQFVPEGFTHDYWTYAVALRPENIPRPLPVDDWREGLWRYMADAIERHGGERPYAAWLLTYQEPAFKHLAGGDVTSPDGIHWTSGSVQGQHNLALPSVSCPVAEDLQPRLLQLQTNDLASAARNATALHKAIREVGG